ncbi:NADH-ubiquinone oxidoreductase 17.8 kDa subunit [Ophiocordyceps camponoti-floridani]|uniref:NADH-ubiquinone oxidoreductase 17.8 kDa subunit n=1 Tax=Ophiocordyceps camponoti-floridani TaxID=2030778 RepID=A0A8H4QBQ8_9HYPO|nr:NADH-ubiquinone oxidoreductase 17.8 kDa subunit [Ophiocordyceps camponoti-floridani]
MITARRRLVSSLSRLSRRYASNATANPQPVAEANESFGTGSIILASSFVGIVLLNQFGPQKGEESALTKFIESFTSRAEDWAEINALHTKAMEQAGFYRNLFENASNKHRWVDVSFPEAIQSYGSRNIPAGHIRRIDDVVEHYRQQHLKEEERKAKKLAALAS